MDRQLIKSLIDAFAASDLAELEYTRDGGTLRLVRGAGGTGRASAAAGTVPVGAAVAGMPVQASVPVPGTAPGSAASPRSEAGSAPMSAPRATPASTSGSDPVSAPGSDALVVAAPAFGIVHLSRSPEAPPLVVPGQVVEAGEALCLVEAMKVFTPLCAPAAGTVAAVLVSAGDEVEPGQPLFRLVR